MATTKKGKQSKSPSTGKKKVNVEQIVSQALKTYQSTLRVKKLGGKSLARVSKKAKGSTRVSLAGSLLTVEAPIKKMHKKEDKLTDEDLDLMNRACVGAAKGFFK